MTSAADAAKLRDRAQGQKDAKRAVFPPMRLTPPPGCPHDDVTERKSEAGFGMVRVCSECHGLLRARP